MLGTKLEWNDRSLPESIWSMSPRPAFGVSGSRQQKNGIREICLLELMLINSESRSPTLCADPAVNCDSWEIGEKNELREKDGFELSQPLIFGNFGGTYECQVPMRALGRCTLSSTSSGPWLTLRSALSRIDTVAQRSIPELLAKICRWTEPDEPSKPRGGPLQALINSIRVPGCRRASNQAAALSRPMTSYNDTHVARCYVADREHFKASVIAHTLRLDRSTPGLSNFDHCA